MAQAAKPAKPAPTAATQTAGQDGAELAQDALAQILAVGDQEARIVGDENESKEVASQAATEGETQTEEAVEQTPSEGEEQTGAEEGETAEEGSTETPDVEDPVLKEYLGEDGQLDKKKLAGDIASLKKAQGKRELTQEEQQILNEALYVRKLAAQNPELLRNLQEADAKARGVKLQAEAQVMTWPEAQAKAKKLREDGLWEEAHALLNKHDPELVAMRQAVGAMQHNTQQQQRDQIYARIKQETDKVLETYEVSEPVWKEMQRLVSEDGMGTKPISTVFKLASINLDAPVKKKAAAGTETKKPAAVVNATGRGVSKGGGPVNRQPSAAKGADPFPEITAAAKQIDRRHALFGGNEKKG